MNRRPESFQWIAILATIVVATLGAPVDSQGQTSAQQGQQVAVRGTFVRIAANDEGWVVVGYRIANESVGENWMLLDIGISLPEADTTDTITRVDIELVAPGNREIPLLSQEEFEKAIGSLAPLVKRAETVGDPISYFPRTAQRVYDLDLFVDPGERGKASVRDQLELSGQYAYLGRIFFEVPNGIRIGTYNLNVKFANSTVKVPMEMMTKERVREFNKEYKKARKESRSQK